MSTRAATDDIPDELASARAAVAARAAGAAQRRADARAAGAAAGPRVRAIADACPDIADGILATDAALAAIADGA